MDWQLPLALLVVAVAGGYLLLRGWRVWRASRQGCGGGCGCAKSSTNEAQAPTLIPAEKLTLRRRPPG